MIDLLISAAIATLITVVPIMFAARIVRARRSNFFAALLAAILIVAVSILAEMYVPLPWLAALLTVVVSAALFAVLLGTTLVRGFAISLLAFIITVGVIVVLSMTLSGLSLAFYSF